MDCLEPASADEAAIRPRSPAAHSNGSTSRKRHSVTQTGNDNTAAGSTVQSHLLPQGMSLVDIQKSYIQKCAIDSGKFHSKFDDICRYGLSASQEAGLWELETQRLSEAPHSTITRNPLASAAAEEWLSNRLGLTILSEVANEVTRNIAVCDFDNKLASFICQHEVFDQNELSLAMREILAERQTRIGERKSGTAIKGNASAKQIRKFYCALVDYVTALVVKHSYFEGDRSWTDSCVTSLARVSAKLKFLSIDSETFADQSLDYARNFQGIGSTRVGEIKESDCARNLSASSWALETLLPIFDDLQLQGIDVFEPNFDLGMIVYHIPNSLRSIPVMMSHDRHTQVSGTSLKSVIWNTDTLLDTLFKVSEAIKANVADKPLTEELGHKRFFIELDLREATSSKSGSLKGYLHTMADVVLVMVPLLLMQPQRLLQLNRTSAPGTQARSFATSGAPFSRYFNTRTEISIFVGLRCSDSHWTPMEMIPLSALFQPLAAQPTFELEGAKSWVIEERLIVVPRRLYVAITIAACGILVVGGILAGLLVGERIPGVDPFNIATFAWVLAAFIILIAKSLSVREWPWRDFLRGQVPCRSVSELHTVTGIDEQRILKYLLANDVLTILTTRGPFNICFTRRSEDGFSIDVKSELHTLMTSGIVVVQVEMATGRGLVCLDLRGGIEGRTSINHIDGPREGERLLGCPDLDDLVDHYAFRERLESPTNSALDIRLHPLSRSMTWTRVLGVYISMNKKFG